VFGFLIVRVKTVDREFLLRVSFMEIYNEIITDLLNPEATNLKITTDSAIGTNVKGLKEEVVVSPDHLLTLMRDGECNES
jgi:centromeric protein E